MATLTSVTLARAMGTSSSNRHLWIGSVTSVAAPAGINKGDLLWFDREAMSVIDANQNPILVRRGANGTITAGHVIGAAGYCGAPHLFSSIDPVGIPPAFPIANPWINTREGRVWLAMGDEVGPGVASRYWLLQTPTYAVGALGITPVTPSTVVTP